MMGVELGLAIFATVDLCFKYGNRLIDIYASFKAAESQLAERTIRLENVLLRTSSQLEFLKSVWHILDEAHRKVQNQLVEVLAGKLKIAISTVENVIEPNPGPHTTAKAKRWKYALIKEGLDRSLDEVEAWQRIFDPSWFLIMKIASPQIDCGLNSASAQRRDGALDSAASLRVAVRSNPEDNTKIFLPVQGLDRAQTIDLPFSSLQLMRRYGSTKWLITESITRPAGANPSTFVKDVRDIARKLSHSDPLAFHLFNCSGVIRHFEPGTQHPTSFTFIFRIPEGFTSPHSLRHVLQRNDKGHSLSERFQIAKDLATAVSSVHSFGFVHKNICPETVILLQNGNSILGTPFLAGFEAFRNADGRTARLGDSIWNCNVYRHPSRQGKTPVDDYVMQHDIYSLGVCLLELGLFESLVMFNEDGSALSPSPTLASSAEDIESAHPDMIAERLITIARKKLPRVMGTIYTNVVVTCLTCLDEDNVDFGDAGEFQDDDGILVGVRYIEKILAKLNDISG